MFNPDGTARKSNLKIVNLRRTATGGVSWEEVRDVLVDPIFTNTDSGWELEY